MQFFGVRARVGIFKDIQCLNFSTLEAYYQHISAAGSRVKRGRSRGLTGAGGGWGYMRKILWQKYNSHFFYLLHGDLIGPSARATQTLYFQALELIA